MKYKIYNYDNRDTHILQFKNYVIEAEFYRFKYWVLAFKIVNYCTNIYLYLPTCCIFINSNKD